MLNRRDDVVGEAKSPAGVGLVGPDSLEHDRAVVQRVGEDVDARSSHGTSRPSIQIFSVASNGMSDPFRDRPADLGRGALHVADDTTALRIRSPASASPRNSSIMGRRDHRGAGIGAARAGDVGRRILHGSKSDGRSGRGEVARRRPADPPDTAPAGR